MFLDPGAPSRYSRGPDAYRHEEHGSIKTTEQDCSRLANMWKKTGFHVYHLYFYEPSVQVRKLLTRRHEI